MHTLVMALWQFDVCMIPRGAPSSSRGTDGYDATPVAASLAARAMAWCEARWPRQTWSEGFFVFGDDQGCRIDMLVDDDGCAELLARIDLRSPHDGFCESVCELASVLDCVLFSPESWCPLRPDADELLAFAGRSRAARFVKDPHAVLRGEGPVC
jgi:hypothetical protein